MDDKVFIFFFLIPSVVTLINYLFLKRTKQGKRLFLVLTSLIVLYIIIAKIVLWMNPHLVHGFAGAIAVMVYWYLLMVITLIIAMVYAFVSLRKKDN